MLDEKSQVWDRLPKLTKRDSIYFHMESLAEFGDYLTVF